MMREWLHVVTPGYRTCVIKNKHPTELVSYIYIYKLHSYTSYTKYIRSRANPSSWESLPILFLFSIFIALFWCNRVTGVTSLIISDLEV